jgi:EAL domain-containing protein (putative c-di-GMP-specific phosphodiesterase class I)
MLTGDVATETRNRALMSGAQDFLTKPIDAVEALLRIANLLQTRELYSNLRRSISAGRDHRFSTAEDRADLQIRIRDVLDRGSVVSVFQPIMDLKSLATAGHESLSRFPGSALRGPDKWFSDAFAVDLGVELEWMAAMSALRYFDTAPPDLFLTINMSPATVLHLAQEDLCIESRCPRIVIELTEHAPVEDYGPLHRALDSIRGRGARLSADDLGSGYAGFRHLFRLKPDVIKLDISLVGGIHRHRGQQALTRAILAFALEMGAQVVAEGIEQLADLRVLQDLGIPFGQGYLLGRPAAVPLCAKVPSEESVVPRPPLRKPRTPPRERANSNSAQLRVQ